MGCSQLDEQQPGSHKEARAEKLVRRHAAHGYWFQHISVLLCVDNDVGELQTLLLMYRSYCLKPASVLCSRRCGTYHNIQRALTRLMRPVSTYWYSFNKAFLCSLVLPQLTRYPGSQYPCCCRYILRSIYIFSRRGYTRNENSNDTSPNRKLYHPCVLVYVYLILRVSADSAAGQFALLSKQYTSQTPSAPRHHGIFYMLKSLMR